MRQEKHSDTIAWPWRGIAPSPSSPLPLTTHYLTESTPAGAVGARAARAPSGDSAADSAA